MLSFHTKATEPVVFRKPLEKYLIDLNSASSKKDKKQVLQTYDADINMADQARNTARNSSSSDSQDALDAIVKYICFVRFMEQKIPFNETQVRIPFTWLDSIRKGKKCLRYDIGLDVTGFAFNHAALSSQLGAGTDRTSLDGLKLSAKYFQAAAGALSFCRDVLSKRALGGLTVDLSAEALTLLEYAMLAQAQHCFCEKARRDGMKPAVLAKLCRGTMDLFEQAHSQFNNAQIAANYNKTWSGLLKMHVHHYSAKMHQSMGREAHANQDYGVEIAYLRQALVEVQNAKALAKVANAQNIVGALLNDVEQAVAKELTDIEKDNNLIYNAPVPDVRSLALPESKVMVKSSDFEANLTLGEGDRVPFQTLLTADAVAALQQHKEKLEELVSTQTMQLATHSNNANSVLAELNLDALLDVSSESALPKSVYDAIAKVNEEGGFGFIDSLITEVVALSNTNRDVLREIGEVVDTEERQDTNMRASYPAMVGKITESKVINAQLRKQIEQLNAKHAAAAAADKIVQEKINKHRSVIESLTRGPEYVKAQCPQPGKGTGNPDAEQALRRVQESRTKLLTVIERREALRQRLKERVESANLEAVLLNSRPPHTAALEADLAQYTPLLNDIKDNIGMQEQLLESLLNDTPLARKGQDSASAARDSYLKSISVAENAYREISANLKEGMEWHTKFNETLNTQLQRMQDFAMSRKMEKQMFAETLSREFSEMTVDAIPIHPSAPDM